MVPRAIAAPLALMALLLVSGPLAAADEEINKTSKDVTDCKKVLDALQLQLKGNTVLCPFNKAMARLAKALKFDSVDALAADVANPSSSNRAAVVEAMKLHVIAGVYLKKDLDQTGNGTNFKTLDGSDIIKLEHEEDGEVEAEGSDGNDFDVVGYDLTFTGTYKPGDPFVVHAIEGVLLPEGSPIKMPKKEKKKKDGEEEGDGEKKEKKEKEEDENEDEKKEKKEREEEEEEEEGTAKTAAPKGVCALLASAGVDLTAKGLGCPKDKSLAKLLDALKVPTDISDLLAALNDPVNTVERVQQVKLAAACQIQQGLLKC